MHNQLVMHIFHHQQELTDYLAPLCAGMFMGEPFIKRHSIYPFHHDTSAIALNFFQTFYLYNARMVQASQNIILFLLKLQVG